MHLLHSAIMVNIVIKEEMLTFGYTENIVINIHFIKVILVREETHLQKIIFFALPEKITDGMSIVDLVYCCCTSARAKSLC